MSGNEVFMILVAAIGFLFGIFVMIFIDGQMIACQRREILKLRKERAALIKKTKRPAIPPMQVVKIIDDSVGAKVDYSQHW
ncbi:MAG: hypothetical protein IKX97_01680 [Erysipelotrichaceae bacterium]|nr:hypothetical protein [Clostridiales bacterium]MBR5754521.1 hypothetical protein [Erysipelotrichaceae bacterium]